MKITVILSLLFVMSCYSIEKKPNSLSSTKPIDELFTKLCLASLLSKKDVFKDISTIIYDSGLDPFLKGRFKRFFNNIIDPFYQNILSKNRDQLKKEIISEFATYVSAMISLNLLSEELQSTSSTPEKLIYNDAYHNFLSNSKMYCWNVYKNSLKKSIQYIGVNVAALVFFNSETVATYFEYNPKDIDNTTLCLRWCGTAIYGSLSFIESTFLVRNSLLYRNFCIIMSALEGETNPTENGNSTFETLRIA